MRLSLWHSHPSESSLLCCLFQIKSRRVLLLMSFVFSALCRILDDALSFRILPCVWVCGALHQMVSSSADCHILCDLTNREDLPVTRSPNHEVTKIIESRNHKMMNREDFQDTQSRSHESRRLSSVSSCCFQCGFVADRFAFLMCSLM